MRNARYQASTEAAIRLFKRSDVVHLATTNDDGAPVLRTLHGVVFRDHLVWHGSPKGEKSTVQGRAGVVSCERIIATIPSWFVDPERACPATTYYESAQASGRIERLEGVEAKAAALESLMQRYQPEGGYRPIRDDDPMYRAVVRNIGLWQLPLERAVAKIKLGQNRTPKEMQAIVTALWQRGGPGDVAAIGRLLHANPSTEAPAFLEAPTGTNLTAWLDEHDVPAAVELLRDTYWNRGLADDVLARAQLATPVWVGARDTDGGLIATARAMSDGAKHAWVYDVAVAPSHRGCGVGSAVMRLLLDHPSVRRAKKVHLGTLDAQDFYRRFGFEVLESCGGTPDSDLMTRLCPADAPCTSSSHVEERRYASGSPRSAR